MGAIKGDTRSLDNGSSTNWGYTAWGFFQLQGLGLGFAF